MKRVLSGNSLAKMYPSTDIDQMKYSSSKHQTTLLSENCIVDTIKVGRFATRAKHYVNDPKKVEDILYKLSETLMNENELSPSCDRSLGHVRNWSVSSNLSILNDDGTFGAESPPHIASYDIQPKGGDKLFSSMHSVPIPPTAPGDEESSDYGSFDEE
eukprot:UN04699